MNPHNDERILDSWEKNASQWTSAVRAGEIESRKLVTNQAIVEAVLSHSPQSVIDIGCGEGWLIRELATQVADLLGVDAVSSLIEQARAAGGGDFRVASYQDLTRGAFASAFDVAVCNFSLLGKESVDTLFSTVPALLNPGGLFVVQTLHPVLACGALPYVDGWREGSWAGFDSSFGDPAPWYFRTLESWVTLFLTSGFQLIGVREPIHPNTQEPASIIFVAATTAGT
ncbi:MAG: class I SAM-dependent methyltransferase [Gammaproteobacteria bacterium]|nr:class I SAM-dependent methyltransferase [Gammaproteobacteria bacterium]